MGVYRVSVSAPDGTIKWQAKFENQDEALNWIEKQRARKAFDRVDYAVDIEDVTGDEIEKENQRKARKKAEKDAKKAIKDAIAIVPTIPDLSTMKVELKKLVEALAVLLKDDEV